MCQVSLPRSVPNENLEAIRHAVISLLHHDRLTVWKPSSLRTDHRIFMKFNNGDAPG